MTAMMSEWAQTRFSYGRDLMFTSRYVDVEYLEVLKSECEILCQSTQRYINVQSAKKRREANSRPRSSRRVAEE